MSMFVDGGLLADIALSVMGFEIIALMWLSKRVGLGPPPADLLANLASGALLLLALRFGVSGGSAAAIVALVTLSGVAHAASLSWRWRALSIARSRSDLN